jgi:ribose transport system substrate-binding protein
MPSDGSVAVQEATVNQYIEQGIKAIAISPVDAKKQNAWLNSICHKVKLITQDSDAPQSARLAYIGTDNHAAGVLAGDCIKRALPNGGKIELFVGNRVAQNSRDREQGIRDALKGSSVQILDVVTDQTDVGLAKKNASDAMTAHPDLSMEVGLYSYNGPAILEAVQEARNVGKVKIVCFDQEKATLAGIHQGAIAATIVQQPYKFGFKGTLLIAQLAIGNMAALPKNGFYYFPAVAVTPGNVGKYIAELNKETGKSWGSTN